MTKDPYKYYRIEAAELLDNLTRGVLELEKGSPDKERIASLLRFAHTLKGASQVVKQPEIGQVAHAVEELLAPYRDQEAPVPRDRTGAVMQLLDQIGTKLAALDGAPAGPANTERPCSPEPLETVRVEVEEMEKLFGSLAEASLDIAAIHSETDSLRRAHQLAAWILQQIPAGEPAAKRDAGQIRTIAAQLRGTLASAERRITAGVERAARELKQVHNRANSLRLLPAQGTLLALARGAQEAAGALGKQVELDISGGEICFDAPVLALLKDALLHLVRNAVAHGIEGPDERSAAGKPRAGKIAVHLRRSGSRVTIVCRDDGRGIDLAAIRRAAVKKGAVSQAEAETLGLREAIDLILKGGISTSAVTPVSGRGIGLDVVRDAVQRLKGDLHVETAPGQGTTIEIRVPVSLATLAAALAESAGCVVALPLESVRETLRLSSAETADAGTGESIVYAGQAVPFLRLSEALGRGAPENGVRENCAIIVTAGGAIAALGARRLLGTGTLLVRSLPELAAADPLVAGAALDVDGNLLLVLDPERVIAAAQGACAHPKHPAGTRRAPILIIDDSLTTRMVEQSLLESAGHQVECAASGEEALEMARRTHYGLFLVDVEMPGMDGYQFILRAHDDPLLREIPSILVTSRSSAADRQRGQEVGAHAFITKSEFDQAQFLETIQGLVA